MSNRARVKRKSKVSPELQRQLEAQVAAAEEMKVRAKQCNDAINALLKEHQCRLAFARTEFSDGRPATWHVDAVALPLKQDGGKVA